MRLFSHPFLFVDFLCIHNVEYANNFKVITGNFIIYGLQLKFLFVILIKVEKNNAFLCS